MTQPAPANQLYFGDNLNILRDYVADESVDLIYLDPPFNSNATYNVLFREREGDESAAQIAAFEDTWHWSLDSELAYQEVVTQGAGKVADLLAAMRSFLGQNDMMAYLTMMTQRMIELHRVLKPTGSIYLHCDPTASHYLKLLMDAVFVATNFRNEIVWKRTSAHSDVEQGARHMGRIHDVILMYSKGASPLWNTVYVPYDRAYVDSVYRYIDPDGRRYQTQPLHAAKPGGDTRYEWKGKLPPQGRYWAFSKENMERLDAQGRIAYSRTGTPRYKIYLEEKPGKPLQDFWDDVSPVHVQPKERLGYPTQKPEALLERIIRASSNEGDVVLDPFCGCGTAVVAAERLNRQWIGIDVTHLAITLIRHRLHDTFGDDLRPYEVIGEPTDVASAQALAQQDRYQFEWWALGLVDARPANDKRRGADSGIDGYINFFDDNSGKPKRIIVQVKSGHVNAAQIRDLKGVLEREQAQLGLFITLQPPTRPMEQEALASGLYVPEHFPDSQFPRLQILTIEQLLAGRQVEYPRIGVQATFRQAPRRRRPQGEQTSLV